MRGHNTKWRYAFVPIILSALLFFSACGVGQGSAITISENQPVKIGVIPVADFAPVYIAADRGFFEDEGINVEIQVMQNAAAIAPAVVNGQLQFGTSAQTPFITAAEKTLPLMAVANSANTALDAEEDVSALMVAENSDIERPRDLEGKVVAVNALNSIIHVAAKAVVEEDGGDPDKVEFVAMPLPDMAQAVTSGQVDAASVVEPFVALSEAQGNVAIARPYTTAFTPGATYALVFTAQPFIDANPELVRKFVAALDRGSAVAQSDPDAVREVLIEYGGLDPEVAEKMRLPEYGPTLSPTAINEAADLMMDLGFLPGPVDGEELVWE